MTKRKTSIDRLSLHRMLLYPYPKKSEEATTTPLAKNQFSTLQKNSEFRDLTIFKVNSSIQFIM